MSSLAPLGRMLVVLGIVLVLVGAGLLAAARFGLPRLPGDVVIERRNLVVYIPVASALVVSVILTLLLNLFLRR